MKTVLCITAVALVGLIIIIALLVWHDGHCMEGY